MAAFASIADDAAERLVHIAERAGTLTRGVGLLATASGGFAYLVGFLVLPGLWRWLWMFAGLLVSATPGLAVWFIATRLRAVVRTAPEMTDELRAATKDKVIRVALLELADLDPGNDDTAPLIQLGKDFAALDTALESHTDDLPVSSRNVSTITSMPGFVALGTVGSFGLLIFCAVAVVIRLVLLKSS